MFFGLIMLSSPQTPTRLRNQREDPAELHGRSFPVRERPGGQRSLVDPETAQTPRERNKTGPILDADGIQI